MLSGKRAKVMAVSGVVLAVAVSGKALADLEGPNWLRDTFASILARLQQVEAVAAQNTASIGALAGEIDALKSGGAQSFDYRNYEATNVTSRTYLMQGAGACGTTEIQRFTRTSLPDGSAQIIQDRERRTAGNVICEHNAFDFRATSDGLYLAGRTGYSAVNPAELVNTNTIEEPLVQRTTAMRIGATWGSASAQTQVLVQGGSTTLGAATQTNSLLGIEAVSVPAGIYANCLKISETRNTLSIGSFTQVSWYCQGVGLAKRVIQPTAGAGFTLTLQAFTTQ